MVYARGKFAVVGLVLTLAAGCAAVAGPGTSAEEMARAHWTAITKNDLGATTKDYAEGAVLEWVGGPLNGKYTGTTAIGGTWTKFYGAQGPLTVDVSNVQVKDEYGKATVPVDYTLVYEGGKIVSEVWKIRP